MDTVDFVIVLLVTLTLATIGLAALAWRYRRAALKAQREVVLLVARTRSAAGYDTGLVEQRGTV